MALSCPRDLQADAALLVRAYRTSTAAKLDATSQKTTRIIPIELLTTFLLRDGASDLEERELPCTSTSTRHKPCILREDRDLLRVVTKLYVGRNEGFQPCHCKKQLLDTLCSFLPGYQIMSKVVLLL